MTRLCTICARGGSKGVPGKNLALIGGRPLIAHSVAQARATGLFEHIAVSSDSDAILAAAHDAGAGHLIRRPAELAADTAAKLPAIAHCVAAVEALEGVRFTTLVDLDATSPLRSLDDICEAVGLLETSGASNVITAAPARRSPYFNLIEVAADGRVTLSKPLPGGPVRRQDAPPCYDMNASIYAWRRDRFMAAPAVFYPDTRLFEMPEERSHDIDSPLDLAIVRWLMERADAPPLP